MTLNIESTSHPTMAELGEKAFISGLLPKLHDEPRLITGHGNDAAAVQIDGTAIAFKIDRAAKPVALAHGWTDHKAWGRMAVTANCSDLLATRASPLAFMVSVNVPDSWLAADVQDIVLGCQEECERNGIAFAGGDTKECSEAIVVGSAFGLISPIGPLKRDGARPGDLLVVTGEVGGFLGAFLQTRSRLDAAPDKRADWIRYMSYPFACWTEASYVNTVVPVRAAVDTSDGIFDGILELTHQSIGVELDLERIPYHPFAIECSRELNIPLENLLFGAGDWNILYAVDREFLRRSPPESAGVIRVIGEFTDSALFTARAGRQLFQFTGPRNEHFRSRLEDGATFVDRVIGSEWYQPTEQ